MKIEELHLGGLRVYWIKSTRKASKSDSSEKENCLFILHGRKGAALSFAEQHLDFLQELSCFSHLFLIDHRNHGERIIDEIQNQAKDKNPNHAIDMYSIQLGSAADIEYLIDIIPLYIHGLGYSNTKWGILGFSLGAHSALLATSHCEKISACISVVGCGDYIKLMESRDVPIPPSLEILISRKDPINNLKSLVTKKILMLGGEHDLLVPPWTNLVFAQKLDAYRAEYRSPPGTLEVTNDPGAKHEFSRFMKDQSISFLKESFDIIDP